MDTILKRHGAFIDSSDAGVAGGLLDVRVVWDGSSPGSRSVYAASSTSTDAAAIQDMRHLQGIEAMVYAIDIKSAAPPWMVA